MKSKGLIVGFIDDNSVFQDNGDVGISGVNPFPWAFLNQNLGSSIDGNLHVSKSVNSDP